MATVLGPEIALALAQRRAAERAAILTAVREFIRGVVEAGVQVEPFEHGDFFDAVRYEINAIEAELRPFGYTNDLRYRKKVTARQRQRLYERDGFTCQRCGFAFERRAVLFGSREDLPRGGITLDHVIPESEGGASIDVNLQTTCGWCNSEKGNNLPDEHDVIPRVDEGR